MTGMHRHGKIERFFCDDAGICRNNGKNSDRHGKIGCFLWDDATRTIIRTIRPDRCKQNEKNKI